MRLWLILWMIFGVCVGCGSSEEARRDDAEQRLEQIGESLKEYEEAHSDAAPQVSHVIRVETEYYLNGPQQARPPDGTFAAGTPVSVVDEAGSYVLVRSEKGIEAYVAADAVERQDRNESE